METHPKAKVCQSPALGKPAGGGRIRSGIAWEVYATRLYHFLRLALAGIFIYAGFMKLLEPRAFAHVIAQYDLVPEGLLPVVAIGLPGLELLAGLGLGFEVRGSCTTMVALLLLFLVVLSYAISQNLDIDCGCFTPSELDARQSLKVAWGRDLVMLGAMVFLVRRRRSRFPQNLWINQLKIILKGEGKK
ncbi:MAG: MauE/DoxX family redox-associated membrane protein [Desulfobaccales bacterium]